MLPNKYSITFACYNAVDHTKLCIDSMIKYGTPLDRLVVVDNGSTDNTYEYLQQLPLGACIYNQQNWGCGVAWNQGVLAIQSEWSIIMNNDVIVSPNWIENLIFIAEQNGLKVVSPALIEGQLDYDFDSFSKEAQKKMYHTLRIGARHAVCLAVHRSVWSDVGYFQPVPRLLGFEDTLFFQELSKYKTPTAMTGASWLHHFGSITQNLMKMERGLNQQEGLSDRNNFKLLKQTWFERKLKKLRKRTQHRRWRLQEINQHGMSIHGLRENENFLWI